MALQLLGIPTYGLPDYALPEGATPSASGVAPTPDLIAPSIRRLSIDEAGNFSVTGAGGGGTLADHYRLFFSPTPGIDPSNAGTYEDYVEVADLSSDITGGPVASLGVRYYFVLAEMNADDSDFEASTERAASPISGSAALTILLLDDD